MGGLEQKKNILNFSLDDKMKSSFTEMTVTAKIDKCFKQCKRY